MNFEDIQPRPVECRQSSMGCALKCKRKWWCQYRMGIVLRGTQIKEAANLGKIYHRLQCLGPGSATKVKAEVRQRQTALMDRVNRGEDLDGQTARLATLLTELYHKAEVMARIFWEKYPQPSYFKTIATEINHTMEWNGLVLSGTIDKLLLNKEDGSVWIRDHKSTGRPLEVLFGGLPWSIQARLYRVLATDYIRIFKEYNPDISGPILRGFILDGILKPGIKLCKTDQKNAKEWKCSNEEAYFRRVKEWYAEKNEDAVRSRGILYTEKFFPPELSQALFMMYVLINRPAHEPEAFERDVSRQECFVYEKQCKYHDLCSTDPKQWGSLFETKYKIEELKEEKLSEEDKLDKVVALQDSDAG